MIRQLTFLECKVVTVCRKEAASFYKSKFKYKYLSRTDTNGSIKSIQIKTEVLTLVLVGA